MESSEAEEELCVLVAFSQWSRSQWSSRVRDAVEISLLCRAVSCEWTSERFPHERREGTAPCDWSH